MRDWIVWSKENSKIYKNSKYKKRSLPVGVRYILSWRGHSYGSVDGWELTVKLHGWNLLEIWTQGPRESCLWTSVSLEVLYHETTQGRCRGKLLAVESCQLLLISFIMFVVFNSFDFCSFLLFPSLYLVCDYFTPFFLVFLDWNLGSLIWKFSSFLMCLVLWICL